MGSIIIKLTPQKLENPDLDLRYDIPDRIKEMTDGKITGDGYDYLDDDSMVIFLCSGTPKEDVNDVLAILKDNIFKGNNVFETAIVYICCDDYNDNISTDEFINKHEIAYQP